MDGRKKGGSAEFPAAAGQMTVSAVGSGRPIGKEEEANDILD